LNLREEVIKDIDDRRVKGNDQSPGDQTDRVEKVHHLKGHEACSKRKNKNTVAKPSEGLITKTLGPLLFSEENSVEKIDGSAHGAEPSTKKIAENENQEKHSEGRKHSQNDLLLREDRNNPDEGIESKVEVNRDLQLKGKSSLDDQIEEEEE
jgi:hypothetical protein